MRKYFVVGAIVFLCSVIAFGAGAYFVLSMHGRYDIIWNIDAICEVALAVFFFLALLLVIISFLCSLSRSTESTFPVIFRRSALICYWLSAACTAGFLLANANGGWNIAIGGALLAVILLRVVCSAIFSRTKSSLVHTVARWVARIAFGITLIATIPSAAATVFIAWLTLMFAL